MSAKPVWPSTLALAQNVAAATDKIAAFQTGGGGIDYVSPSVGYRARAFGTSSTCTASAHGAVVNWLENVRKRSAP